MARVLGRIAWAVAAVAVLAVAVALLPRERVAQGAVPVFDDPAAFLAEREAGFDDIRQGDGARIVWAGEAGAVTPVAVLYLHGFSAGPEEIRPVPDAVAAGLGANLVYARLSGHGRDGDAMAEPRAGDWLADTALFLDIARAVGERVIVIGTSTGGTLAAWAATDPAMARDVAGMVFVAPNFALANPAGVLLEWPYARVWAPMVAGAERAFEPMNEGQAAHWTTRYPIGAAVTLGTLLREMRGRDLGQADMPALVLFSDADQVVSAQATRAAMAGWGGPVDLVALEMPAQGADPFAHVIAGDIMSPAMTAPVTARILEWAAGLAR